MANRHESERSKLCSMLSMLLLLPPSSLLKTKRLPLVLHAVSPHAHCHYCRLPSQFFLLFFFFSAAAPPPPPPLIAINVFLDASTLQAIFFV